MDSSLAIGGIALYEYRHARVENEVENKESLEKQIEIEESQEIQSPISNNHNPNLTN